MRSRRLFSTCFSRAHHDASEGFRRRPAQARDEFGQDEHESKIGAGRRRNSDGLRGRKEGLQIGIRWRSRPCTRSMYVVVPMARF